MVATLASQLMAAMIVAAAPEATAPSDVTVVAPRRRDVPETVSALAAPHSGDRLARWRTSICPLVVGLDPVQAAEIQDRIVGIARAANIAASPPKCRREDSNVIVVFSARDLLDRRKIAEHANGLLGQGKWPADRDQLASFVKDDGKPAHVFYAVGPVADRGSGQALDDVSASTGVAAADVNNNLGFTGAPVVQASGSRLTPSVDEAFNKVVVVIDGRQVKGVTTTQIAAYLTMIVLAEVKVDAPIRNVQTVTRLFADLEAQHPPAEDLTFFDRAYLGALYGVSTQSTLAQQRTLIEQRIEHAIDVLDPAGAGVAK